MQTEGKEREGERGKLKGERGKVRGINKAAFEDAALFCV